MAQGGWCRWVPVVAWMGLIFVFSHQPGPVSQRLAASTPVRKLAHLGEYAVLGALAGRAAGRPLPALALGAAYAATDEWHQTFVPGRSGQAADVLLDSAGAAAGAWLWHRRRRGGHEGGPDRGRTP